MGNSYNEKELVEKLKINIDQLKNQISVPYDFYTTIKSDMVKVFEDFNKVILDYLPIHSEDYSKIRKFLEENYYSIRYKKEYCLCIKKDTPYPDIFFKDKIVNEGIESFVLFNRKPKFLLREKVEYNPEYYQISCAGLLVQEDKETGEMKFIILKSKKGELSGKYTLIQGHCSYDTKSGFLLGMFDTYKSSYGYSMQDEYGCEYDNEYEKFALYNFRKYIETQLSREICEETGLFPEQFKFNISDLSKTSRNKIHLKNECFDIYPDFTNMKTVSYYHMGQVMIAYIDPDVDINNLCNPESEKHDISILTMDELLDIYKKHPNSYDAWLSKTILKVFY